MRKSNNQTSFSAERQNILLEISETNKKMYQETNFKEHYEKYVAPHVHKFESLRLEKLHIFNKRMNISVVVFCIIFVICLFLFKKGIFELKTMEAIKFFIVGGVITFGLLCFWVIVPYNSYKLSIKKEIFPHIFSFFGEDFIYREQNEWDIHTLQASEILPHFDNAIVEDYIKGSYSGVGIELVEANLTLNDDDNLKHRRHYNFTINGININIAIFIIKYLKNIIFNNKKNIINSISDVNIVFNGIIIRLDMNKNFISKTIIKNDTGKIGNFFQSKHTNLENVRLEDPLFENEFEVYSENQVEARVLLTTSFMDRLLKLKELFQSSQIECSFYDNELLMMIPSTLNRFETKSIFYPVDFEDDMKSIVQEMHLIFGIIDTLKLNQKIGI